MHKVTSRNPLILVTYETNLVVKFRCVGRNIDMVLHRDYTEMQNVCPKIKRNVGILSKLRHYVNIDILTNLYYSLIYAFLTYSIIIYIVYREKQFESCPFPQLMNIQLHCSDY